MSFPLYPAYKDSGVPWLAKVPAHWNVLSLKRLFSTVGDRATERRFPVVLDNIKGWTGRYVEREGKGEFDGDGVAFRRGDILYGKLRPYLAKTWLADRDGEAVGDFHVLRAMVPIETAFYRDLLLTPAVVSVLNSSTQGAKMPRVSWDFIGMMKVVQPPVSEQRAITAFVERETAILDSLAAEQEALLGLLEEKRVAVIAHLATRGLDPNAPTKDSGVEWLGRVPAHWEVMQLRRAVKEMCDGPFGSGLKSDHYTLEGARVVRLQNIRAGWFDDRDAAFVAETYFRTGLAGHEVLPGDVLVAGLGDERNLVGRACVAPDNLGPALVKADCFRLRIDAERYLPSFLAAQLTAGAAHDAGRFSNGSTRSRIPLSVTATRRVAVPPTRAEQERIMEAAAKSLANMDDLAAEARSSIALLRERRAALISAAVTGRIDVRAAESRELEVVA